MRTPDRRAAEILAESSVLSAAREELAAFRERTDPPLPAHWETMSEIKRNAVAAGDQLLARAVWFAETIGKAQGYFTSGFARARADEFYEFWCSLERCEIQLHFLESHFRPVGEEFGIVHMETHVPRFQDLFPYKWFASPGFIVRRRECSICGAQVKLRGDSCSHELGEIYDGEMAGTIVRDWQPVHVALVKHPVQKYSVPQGIPYDYGVVRYLVRAVRSPWDGWKCTKSQIEEQAYPGTGRNERCPCGSGSKYKKCCLEKPRIREHHQFEFDSPPAEDCKPFVAGDAASFVITESSGPPIS